MDKNKYEIIRLKMEKCANALRKNNIYCECVENCEEALDVISGLISSGDTVTVGGSMTLFESGVIDMLRESDCNFLDRYAEGANVQEIYEKAYTSDVYFMSSNAITENGELYNVDGNGNRISALAWGPKSVIVVAGYNKIVKDLDEAQKRVKQIAAPANAKRLGCDTPCTKAGQCMNCSSPSRICASALTVGKQIERHKNRIKVILIGEELGY